MHDLPKLLKKYANNTCTTEERARVEEWLAMPSQPFVEAWPEGEDEHAVKQQLWSGIQQATVRKPAIKRRMIYIPAAAACLLLALVPVLQHTPLSKTLTFSNTSGLQARQFNIGGLQLNLQPNSRCTLEVPLFGEGSGNVQLCGAVAVINTSGREINLRVNSGAGCADLHGSDAITLHKGQTYLAMTDRELNLIAATEAELRDGLPRVFSSRLSERFKL